MYPVHEFKANFSQPAGTRGEASDNLTDAVSFHESDSSVRNVCFMWEDGRRAFFNYAYLVASDLTVQGSINVLVLSFGTYTVIVKGYRLSALFEALLEHSPKVITAVNPRYLPQRSSQQSVVTEIVVKSD